MTEDVVKLDRRMLEQLLHELMVQENYKEDREMNFI